MARVVSLILFLLSWLLLFSHAASKKSPSTSARKEDIPYIKCQVCEKIAHQIHRQVQKKEAEVSPKKVPCTSVMSCFSCFDWIMH
jgi:hypothetical protein